MYHREGAATVGSSQQAQCQAQHSWLVALLAGWLLLCAAVLSDSTRSCLVPCHSRARHDTTT